MIVADTGPIIAFARLGRLELLHQVVETLVIPEAVYAELVSREGATDQALQKWSMEDGCTAGR